MLARFFSSKQSVTILTVDIWVLAGLGVMGWMAWSLWGPKSAEDIAVSEPLNVATMQRAIDQIDEDALTANVPTVTLVIDADTASDSAEIEE